MKILHLSGSKNHWSGNEQQLADLISNLNELGVENAIFCYQDAAIEAHAKENNIVHFSQERKSIYSPKLAKSLKNVIQKQKIDTIHVHTSNFLTVFMVSDLLFHLNIPCVFSRKGFSEKSSFVSALKYNYKNINRTICVSKAVKKGLMNFVKPKNHDKLVVIYDGISTQKNEISNPLNLREKFGIDANKKLIGNIANHVPAKDLETFIKTAHHLIHQLHQTEVHFIVIGEETAITPSLNELIDELNLTKQITFAGKIPHAKELIPQLDIFFMSSKSEGLPLTIYESFLYEKPVVSTVAGGIPEAITDEENGFLADIGDYETLAKKLNRLINEPSLNQKFIEKSRQLLHEKFDAKICAKQTLDLYKEIINESL